MIGADIMNETYCVCCGANIPEGRMICWDCEHSFDNSNCTEEEVEENKYGI
jgi:predicted amidophosphoribosyltransferase